MGAPLVVFGLLNFGALAIGSYFTGPGVRSEWYQHLDKAPWTPPGWVFGAAWTVVMIGFTLFMSWAWTKSESKVALVSIFLIQWILNVSWNPVFFSGRPTIALLLIILLFLAVIGFAYRSFAPGEFYWWMITPYVIWLSIAVPLNGYIVFRN